LEKENVMALDQTVANRYRHFHVALYATVYDVRQMADLKWLKASFETISARLGVDKVYLETHRDTVMADEATIEQARAFLNARGVRTAGGITLTVNERNRFETYCYTRPEHRQKVREIVEYTARLFDELILDDFFFTSCKCASCIDAKGDRSWTEFRLALMAEAAQSLVIGPAKAVNPQCTVVCKYPNWYEHFPGLGFNLEAEPPLFDGLYTGTETRDPLMGHQHLQPYHGYSIFRYLENIKPGGNGGGWVDPFGSRVLDRYAEQLWLTLFAKAPEHTLFHYGALVRPIEARQRAAWQGTHVAKQGTLLALPGTGFDFDAMVASAGEGVDPEDKETWPPELALAYAAGTAFELVDPVLGLLGEPVGVQCYKPHHSHGEDYLHSYLGMLGIPIDLVPEFPSEAETILLTESARFDPNIVAKVKAQLVAGKNVVVTSGFFYALQGQGLRDIVELTVTDRKASVQDFQIGWFGMFHAESPLLIPHVDYFTNDSWEEVSANSGTTGHPLLHSAGYANGTLYLLVVPDNFDDRYKLPEGVLARIRSTLMGELPVRVDGPAQVALFLYDNQTCIVESFLPEPARVKIVVDDEAGAPQDALTGETLSGEPILDWRRQPTGKSAYEAALNPHVFRVFRIVS